MTTVDWKTNSFNRGIAHALAECSSIVYDDDKEKTKDVLKKKVQHGLGAILPH